MRIAEQYLAQLNSEKRRWRRAAAILTVLSLFVATGVSWNLRMTGITIANGASCGLEEHQHSEACGVEIATICGFDEETWEEAPPQNPIRQEIKEEIPQEELPTDDLPAEEIFEEEVPAEEEPSTETFEGELFVEEEAEDTLPMDPMAYFGDGAAEEEVSDEELTALAAEFSQAQPAFFAFEEEEEEAHVHTDDCYEITYLCELEEHTHLLACYSDTTADLEDWRIWEADLPELTGQMTEDLILIAQSQLGMGESENNFEVEDDGETRNGITRYGQWYGNPYGPWSNMFTSFCLHYAGFTEISPNSGAAVLQRDWEEAGLYRSADSYEPLAGDIVFLDKNENGQPEATGIVVDFFDGILTVIEGDVDNVVAETEYAMDDPVILGYGITDPGSRLTMFALSPNAVAEPYTVAQTVNYSSNLLSGGTFLIYATANGRHYAIDGNGGAVEIWIDSKGRITSDLADPNMLYWTFTSDYGYDNQPGFIVVNVGTGMHLHPSSDTNKTISDNWNSVVYSEGNGVKIRGAYQNGYLQLQNGSFIVTTSRDSSSTMRFGKMPDPVTLWLDGTNGNIMAYRGSNNTKYSVIPGTGMQLPTSWKSPDKYGYKLAGWVDIQTGDYYAPGDRIDISENTVLYADWVAITYDIGRYNSAVADTVSTNDFITTKVFDYSSLINLLSSKVTATVTADSHSESFAHVGSGGTVTYKDQTTLDFSFNDHDSSGTITSLTDLNPANKYTGGTAVYPGIYNAELDDVLFGTDNLLDPETGEGIIGKHYLGEGDHLFQINDDPTSEWYGYYYYDAKLNAASYNQSDQRFYVYNYLARTSDSSGNGDDGQYSDFLPLNSPYANTNGTSVATYSYSGDNSEYSGVTHYQYDARADSSGTRTNLWFGMRVDIRFALPDAPGSGGNKDIYGNDMHFKFTGDDDVWVLIDDEVVLDLGGIHQAAEGEINFSTGEVTVEGTTTKLQGVSAGERTLSILYLERGASMSNCAIYFNLAPRFSLEMQKEDVLTQEVLQGAKFAFYYDEACTEACRLWPSREAYKADPEGNKTNIFTIGRDGTLRVWGLDPAKTYYIKEVGPPTPKGWENLPESLQYALTNGIIRLTLDKNGLNSYSATILEEPGADPPVSHGFTVHGFRIDEGSQTAYVNITNARNWVEHTTSVYVQKIWNDREDHTYDGVTVYLNVTDPDGTVRRLREITLSRENDWEYTWTNLPLYVLGEDGLTESEETVKYSVSEAYISGYTASVIKLKNGEYTETTWGDSDKLTHGQSYLLRNGSQYLSAVSADKQTLCWVDEAAAKTSPLALWTATVSDSNVKLTNGAGQSLTYYSSGSTRYYYLTTGSSTNQNLKQTTSDGRFRLGYTVSSGWGGSTTYYLSELNSSSYASASSNSNHIYFVAEQKKETTTSVALSGYGYQITNTPLSSETALKVVKYWDDPSGKVSRYEQAQVTFRLLANNKDTGRTETVSLKTNWTATFRGLPYYDENGKPIIYTVEESWDNDDWIPIYGSISTVNGTIPTYETTVTNQYRWTNATELPATGGLGILPYILCGVPLVAAPLVYGLSLRRKYERGVKE